jgi:AbrB family looped-hinge helix DNA binding protein
MQTRVSTKGQVVLPSVLRQKLGIEPGDPLEAKIEGDRIVLTPRRKPKRKLRIHTSPITGMTVISTGGPKITSRTVYAALEDFP